jgi:DNA repair protein RecO (recombination protein O)
MAAFYLNELLLKLTTRHDSLPGLFDDYHEALESLRHGAPLAVRLRIFEKRLLQSLGYGVDLTREAETGRRIEPDQYYQFRPAQGLFPALATAPGVLAGRSLISLYAEQLTQRRELEDARRLLQAALAQCLEGRELVTRSVAKSLRRPSPKTAACTPK